MLKVCVISCSFPWYWQRWTTLNRIYGNCRMSTVRSCILTPYKFHKHVCFFITIIYYIFWKIIWLNILIESFWMCKISIIRYFFFYLNKKINKTFNWNRILCSPCNFCTRFHFPNRNATMKAKKKKWTPLQQFQTNYVYKTIQINVHIHIICIARLSTSNFDYYDIVPTYGLWVALTCTLLISCYLCIHVTYKH